MPPSDDNNNDETDPFAAADPEGVARVESAANRMCAVIIVSVGTMIAWASVMQD